MQTSSSLKQSELAVISHSLYQILSIYVCFSLAFLSVSSNFSQDDDFVFEDFARLRLKGMKDEEDDHFC